jgi:arylsulfatase
MANHLGDRDEFLPTNHGFDEFFGNLYHLNAEQEPEMPYWPKDDPVFLEVYNPRGVIHSYADEKIEDTHQAHGNDRRRNGLHTEVYD